ncbi:hypothetical protein [uncultured Lactobacillus sp.]
MRYFNTFNFPLHKICQKYS